MAETVIAGNVFNKYASTNPLIRRMMDAFWHTVRTFLGTVPFDSLLDIGSGEGYLLEKITAAFPGRYICGSDYSREIQTPRAHTAPALCCSATSLPFKDQSWDVVTACEVLEHLPEPERACSEIARVMRHAAIITVPLEPWWRVANMVRGKYVMQLGNTPGHVQHWSKQSFRRLIERYFAVRNHTIVYLWQCALVSKK